MHPCSNPDNSRTESVLTPSSKMIIALCIVDCVKLLIYVLFSRFTAAHKVPWYWIELNITFKTERENFNFVVTYNFFCHFYYGNIWKGFKDHDQHTLILKIKWWLGPGGSRWPVPPPCSATLLTPVCTLRCNTYKRELQYVWGPATLEMRWACKSRQICSTKCFFFAIAYSFNLLFCNLFFV